MTVHVLAPQEGIDTDLTVSLARELRANGFSPTPNAGPAGTGRLAMCRLAGERGTFGQAVKSPLLERR